MTPKKSLRFSSLLNDKSRETKRKVFNFYLTHPFDFSERMRRRLKGARRKASTGRVYLRAGRSARLRLRKGNWSVTQPRGFRNERPVSRVLDQRALRTHGLLHLLPLSRTDESVRTRYKRSVESVDFDRSRRGGREGMIRSARGGRWSE